MDIIPTVKYILDQYFKKTDNIFVANSHRNHPLRLQLAPQSCQFFFQNLYSKIYLQLVLATNNRLLIKIIIKVIITAFLPIFIGRV